MTDQEPQRKKGGRPRKHSPEAKRPTMAFRMSSQLHEKLIASASVNERSLSEEIERKLEDSFSEQYRLAERFGGQENLQLLTTIASSWMLIETMSKQKWTESNDVLRAIIEATNSVFAMVKMPELEAAPHGSALAKLGEPYRNYAEVQNFAVASAAHAVAMAKRMDIGPKIENAVVEAAIDFKRRSDPK